MILVSCPIRESTHFVISPEKQLKPILNSEKSRFVYHIISKVVASSPILFYFSDSFQMNSKINILELEMTSAKLDMVIIAHTCASCSLTGP